MNILFLTLSDFNSIDERGIYTDLLREFVKNEHKVYIISPVEKRKNLPTKLINNVNYQILKLKVGNIQKTNFIEKGISTLTLESKFISGIKKYFSEMKSITILQGNQNDKLSYIYSNVRGYYLYRYNLNVRNS